MDSLRRISLIDVERIYQEEAIIEFCPGNI
jgi:hypothetical protein